jgi:hypothetical protein
MYAYPLKHKSNNNNTGIIITTISVAKQNEIRILNTDLI